MDIEIIVLKLSDLGFPDGATTREIIGTEGDTDSFGHSAPFTAGKVQQMGLCLCLAEVGPQFRLQYEDQPLHERLYVAMKPIATSDGEPRIFVLAHKDDGLSLDAIPARAYDYWDPNDKFVFCLQRE